MSTIPSYVFGNSDIPLLGETIGYNLKNTVKKYPNQTALIVVHQNIQFTYQQFWDYTTQIAKGLVAAGIQKGDRVGIWAPNCYEWVVIQYATARIGAILVNLNPAYRSQDLLYVLNQSKMKLIVSALKFKTSNYKQMLTKVKRKAEYLEQTVFLDQDWENLKKQGESISEQELEQIEATIQFDEPINIQYTSGTTGFPKGVTLSHHNVLNNGYFIGERLRYTNQDIVCIPVPFFHCFGMVIGNMACTTHGSTMVIPGDNFNPADALQAVQTYKCTSLYGVPTMFIAELQLPNFADYDLTSLRTGVMAGSPCPIEVMKQVQSKMYMKEVSICYGMTETSPVSTQTKIGAPLDKQVQTVGTIQDHLEIKIIDPVTKQIVPRGVPGELCVRGYSVMLKYWDNPEATAAVIDDARWMHTGDIGVIDEDGYVSITGRIKDIIIRGGENVSPREIEEFLYTHKSVEDVQVIGVPDPKYGEAIMAWIKPIAGCKVTEDDFINFCKDQIAHYKVPKYWKFVDGFPMTISGKVRKVEMREIAVKELGL
ncbi:AMP-binding protein [Flavobacterium agricola]|uniref:AMP-binding protein n=1 Tax=Flavobacterium agricola TaxID=2870839 RepID=A0ABY6M2K2_9FLAO|nr:AMP-binding protein [Flavobacterium agricola]UYW01528.1 AMP-binding protein [Flavobacterium agricola]